MLVGYSEPMDTPPFDVLLVSSARGRLFARMRQIKAEVEAQGVSVKHWVPLRHAEQVPQPGGLGGTSLVDLLPSAKTVMATSEEGGLAPLLVGHRRALGMSPPLYYENRPDISPDVFHACPEEAIGEIVPGDSAIGYLIRISGRKPAEATAAYSSGSSEWEPWKVYLPDTRSDDRTDVHADSPEGCAFRQVARERAIFAGDAEMLRRHCAEPVAVEEKRQTAFALAYYGTDELHAKLHSDVWAWVFAEAVIYGPMAIEGIDDSGVSKAAIARGGVFADRFCHAIREDDRARFLESLESSREGGQARVGAALHASMESASRLMTIGLSSGHWDLLTGRVSVANPLDTSDELLPGRTLSLGFWHAAMRHAESPVQLISRVARRIPKRAWSTLKNESALPLFVGLHPPRSPDEFAWWENLLDPGPFGRTFAKLVVAGIFARWPYITNRIAEKGFALFDEMYWLRRDELEFRLEEGPYREKLRLHRQAIDERRRLGTGYRV